MASAGAAPLVEQPPAPASPAPMLPALSPVPPQHALPVKPEPPKPAPKPSDYVDPTGDPEADWWAKQFNGTKESALN